jgi:spectinomycin phosphotransferase
LDRRELAAVLERLWSLRDVALDYLPVGFGSHHWRAEDEQGQRRFITVDDLYRAGPDADSAFFALDRAFRTAVAVRDDAGLEFVVAPCISDTGSVLHRISERSALTVLPLIEGTSSLDGAYQSAEDRRQIGTLIGRLHAATHRVAGDLPHQEDFALPSRDSLEDALRNLDREWTTGPFAEPTRDLLAADATHIERRLREYDALAARVRESASSWVITHGEPHAANVIRDQKGLHVVDWGWTMLAPRERDLKDILDEDHTGWAEYAAQSGAVAPNPTALELHRKRWALAEIAEYVALFRRPHERTQDTTKSWTNLTAYLPIVRP